jgi:hypothetical protein
MEEKIKQYINDIIQDPLINLYDHAVEIFGDNPLTKDEVKLVIPELAEISVTKRRLARDIVYQKTKYDIAIAKDVFLDNTIILADKTEV